MSWVRRRGRLRLAIACAATALVVGPLAFFWQVSLLPGEYSVMDIGVRGRLVGRLAQRRQRRVVRHRLRGRQPRHLDGPLSHLRHAAEGLVAHLMYEGISTPYAVGGRAGNQPE
jgi:hypothetical protein